jgi:stage II sporulation protein AA (anti-sigma F factor antagonist)
MASSVFEVQQTGQTLIVTPLVDLREFDYGQIEKEAADVLDQLAQTQARNVILDFHRTDYYGSTALGFFVRLWKRVRQRGGRMAFCNVSAHEKEILEVTSLDRLWPICSSREEALRAVEG